MGTFESSSKNGIVSCNASLFYGEQQVQRTLNGNGNGPLAAFVHGFKTAGYVNFEIANYSEHALSASESAAAISYIQIKTADGKSRWGAGVDTNIELASIQAVLSALNRL